MGKKLGLDDLYKSIGVFPKNTSKFMERGLTLKAGSGGKKYSSALTTSVNKGSKLLNVGKKVFSKTPIGKAVNLAINVGSGIGIGYSYAKNKFNKKKADFQKGDYSDIKTDKKMAGGMMQGYGAARTSGMGLEDQSLMPGKMVRASKGKMTKMNKGGGMDMGKKEKPTQWITKKEKPTQWITKKEKPKKWITKKSRGGGMDMGAAQGKVDRIRAAYNLAKKNKGEDRLTQADIKMAEKTLKAYENLKKNK